MSLGIKARPWHDYPPGLASTGALPTRRSPSTTRCRAGREPRARRAAPPSRGTVRCRARRAATCRGRSAGPVDTADPRTGKGVRNRCSSSRDVKTPTTGTLTPFPAPCHNKTWNTRRADSFSTSDPSDEYSHKVMTAGTGGVFRSRLRTAIRSRSNTPSARARTWATTTRGARGRCPSISSKPVTRSTSLPGRVTVGLSSSTASRSYPPPRPDRCVRLGKPYAAAR